MPVFGEMGEEKLRIILQESAFDINSALRKQREGESQTQADDNKQASHFFQFNINASCSLFSPA